MNFPTLFKKNTQGKMMQWSIDVTPGCEGGLAWIRTRFGQVDGAIQTTMDAVSEGKNLGRANATTALQQAEAEAKSKWERQQTIKGYVVDYARAERSEDDRQGFKPMLAKSFDKDGKKIQWPAAQQPKLDGMRAPSLVSAEGARLYSRNGKPITAVPHIAEQLIQAFGDIPGGAMVDGELYNHDLKNDFEELISIARKASAIDSEQRLQLHIYDIAGTDHPFWLRSTAIRQSLMNEDGTPKYPHLRFVETRIVDSEEEARAVDGKFVAEGYEGSMLRNLDSLYEDKRSANLQKVKLFIEDEFQITGMEEGRGKLMGHAACLVCATADGKEFKAKLEGKMERLKEMFADHSLWKGKMLTVKFQNYTKDGIPRFPVGKAIRDYE